MSKKDDKKLIVNMISESEFTVQGHGVHTAYKEITDALRKRKDIDIEVNLGLWEMVKFSRENVWIF